MCRDSYLRTKKIWNAKYLVVFLAVLLWASPLLRAEKLPLPTTIPFLTLFRLDACMNPQAAFEEYADAATAKQLQALGGTLCPISDSSQGWQLFFSSSIATIASLDEQTVLTMFYNPWSDVVLLCEWTQPGDIPKITQVKLVCGDAMRNTETPILLPLWRRTGDVPPSLAAIVATGDTMHAFMNLYGKRPKWPANQWPDKLPTLKTDNPDKDGNKMVGILFSHNLSGISTFFDDPECGPLKALMDKIRQQLIAGQVEAVLAQAPETIKESRQLLSQMTPEDWQLTTMVSLASDAKHAFVFLSGFGGPQVFACFWFNMDDNSVILHRIDFFRYDLSFEEMDKLARQAGMKRP